MKHIFLSALLGCALLSATPAHGASDAKGNFIYVLGWDNIWYPPTSDNPESVAFYENKKLYETEPGSNIYTGVLEPMRNGDMFFRFTTSLDTPEKDCYSVNNIGPAESADAIAMRAMGASGVYGGVCMLNTTPGRECGSWYLSESSLLSFNNYISPGFRVDLNTNEVYVFSGTHGVAAIADYKGDFSWSNVGNYVTVDGRQFLSPGAHTLTYLRYADEATFGANELPPLLYSGNYTSVPMSEGENPVSISDKWPGGILATASQGYIRFQSTIYAVPESHDYMLMVGEYCDWDVDKAITLDKGNAEGSLFKGVVPAGKFYFVTDASWKNYETRLTYGPGFYYERDTDGNLVMQIRGQADVFDIEAPEGTPFLLDFTKGTVTFESSAAEFHSDYVLTEGIPGAGSLPDVPDNAIYLNGNVDGVVPTTANLPYIYPYLYYREPENQWPFYLPAQNAGYNFITKVGATAADATVAIPEQGSFVLDRTMFDDDGMAVVKMTEAKGADSGYLYLDCKNYGDSNNTGRTYEITFNPADMEAVVYCADFKKPEARDELYIVGTPNGWNIWESEYVIPNKGNGVYSATYEIAADAEFRFFTSLGDWSRGSIGSEYSDFYSEDVTQLPFEGSACWGMGNWKLSGPESGFITFTLTTTDAETWTLKMERATSGVENVPTEACVTVKGGRGCIEIEAPYAAEVTVYDLAGRMAAHREIEEGVTFIPLQAGVYIVNGTKVLVK